MRVVRPFAAPALSETILAASEKRGKVPRDLAISLSGRMRSSLTVRSQRRQEDVIKFFANGVLQYRKSRIRRCFFWEQRGDEMQQNGENGAQN